VLTYALAALAALLAIAGSTFGLTAALMKAMTLTFAGGLGELFTSWEIYAMVAAGVLGMFLTQAHSPLVSGADSASEDDGEPHEPASASAGEAA
jgi:hypothetical protein